MICASVPLQEVSAHLDATLGDEDDAPATIRQEWPAFLLYDADGRELEEPVFLLRSLRPAA